MFFSTSKHICHYINDLHKKIFSRVKSNLILYISIGKNSFSHRVLDKESPNRGWSGIVTDSVLVMPHR